MSQLRKTLEPGRAARTPGEVVLTRAPGYELRLEPQALDAARFERLLADGRDALAAGEAGRASELLRSALALWRGHALDGAADAPSAQAEAARLEELRVEALEDRIDADLALGQDRTLVPELEVLVKREPLRERPRGQLMLALYRSGRQADALDLYKETRRTFVERLGIEPTPRLRELEQAILAQDRELDAGLPRLRPPAVLRGRSRRLLLGVAVALLATVAATATIVAGGGTSVVGEPGSVAVVDPKSARVVDTVEVGSGPVAVVSGHGSLWVANSESGTVSRIDPVTRDVQATLGIPSPVDLAAGPDAIWVAGGISGTVSRIDPEANDVVATIDLRSADPFDPRTVNGIAAGAGAVWVAVSGRGLAKIDPSENQVVRWIDVGGDQVATAVGHGAVWVVVAGKLRRLEPTTGSVTATLSVGSPGSFANDVVATDDGILVLATDIWVVDPGSMRLIRTLTVGTGDPLTGNTVTAVADDPAGFWAVNFNGTLARLDPILAEAPVQVQLRRGPTAIAIANGDVWVTIGDAEF